MYAEVSLDHTMKLLIRCKLAFNSRAMLFKLFEYVTRFRERIEELRVVISKLKQP